jgi:hypothetical protein
MAVKSWEERWESYIRQVSVDKRTPAHRDIRETRSQLHATLSKVTSALVTQIRTKKIGLNAFLLKQRVLGYTAAC